MSGTDGPRYGAEAALLLIDLQHDFLPGGALGVPGGDEVLSVASRVHGSFDWIVATQDWHPPDHGSFAANHPGKKVGEVIDLNGLRQILWPVHCVQQTPGAALAAGREISRIDHVVHKGTDPEIDSYSAFFDNGHRKSTGLDAWLRQRRIRRVFLMGLATDYCVKFSALDARRLGFEVTLIEDGCRGVNLEPGDARQAVAEMRESGVETVASTIVAGEGDESRGRHS